MSRSKSTLVKRLQKVKLLSPHLCQQHILPANEAPLLHQNLDSASNRPEQNPVSNNESIVESSIPKSISRTGEVVEKVGNTSPDNKYFTNTSIDTVLSSLSKQIKSSDSDRPASFVEYKRGMPLVKDCDMNKYDIGHCIKEKPKSSELYDVI